MATTSSSPLTSLPATSSFAQPALSSTAVDPEDGPLSPSLISSSAPSTATVQANPHSDLPPSSPPPKPLHSGQSTANEVNTTSSTVSLAPPTIPQPKPSRTYSRGGNKRPSEALPPVFVHKRVEEEASITRDTKGKGRASLEKEQDVEDSSDDDDEAPAPVAVAKKKSAIMSDDESETEDDVATRLMEEMRREARGLSPIKKPEAVPDTSNVVSSPRSPVSPTPAPLTAASTFLLPSPPTAVPRRAIPLGLDPLRPTSFLSTLQPTSEDDLVIENPSPAFAPAAMETEDDEQPKTDPVERASYQPKKKARRVVNSASENENEDEDDAGAPVQPRKLVLGRTKAVLPASSEAGGDDELEDERLLEVGEISARRSVTVPNVEMQMEAEGSRKRTSSEEIGEFESSPKKKIKPLPKKEQLLMRKETASLKRAERATLTRPDQVKKGMGSFLSGLEQKKKLDALKPINLTPKLNFTHPRSSFPPKPSSAVPSTAPSPAVATPLPPPQLTLAFISSSRTVDHSGSNSDEEMPEVGDVFAAKEKREKERKQKGNAARLKQLALLASQNSKLVADVDSDDSDLEILPPRPKVKAEPNHHAPPSKTSTSELSRRHLALAGAAPARQHVAHPHALDPASESQLVHAGKTFGHALKRDVNPAGKAKYNSAVDQAALNARLLLDADAAAKRERAAKERKYGAGRTLAKKEERDMGPLLERLMVLEEANKARKHTWDRNEDMEDEDPEDGDFRLEGEEEEETGGMSGEEEAETQTAGEETDEEEGGSTRRVAGSRSEDEGPGEVMSGDDSSFDSDKENSRPTGMIDAQDDKENAQPRLSSRPSLPLSDRGLPLAQGSDADDDNEEEDIAIRRKPGRSRGRTVRISDEDDEEVGPLRTLSRTGSASSLTRLTLGDELSPASSNQLGARPTSSGLGFGLGAAFGDDEAGSGGGGFGEGGFSQLFVPTQLGTDVGSGSVMGGGDSGGFDFGEDAGGFSQLFEPTQIATAASDIPVGGGLQALRLPEGVMAPQASLLPHHRISETQAQRDGEILDRNAPIEVEVAATQAPAQYINAQGFITQTKPSNYKFDSPSHDSNPTPTTNRLGQTSSTLRDTPQGLTQFLRASSNDKPPLLPYINLGSSPTKPTNTNRRLVARGALIPAPSAASGSEEGSPPPEAPPDVVASPPDSSSPTKKVHASIFTGPSVVKNSRKPRPAKSAFVDGEAEESDDEEAGFGGFGLAGAGGKDDEEEEDQDKPVEGLVDDEEMSAEKKEDDNARRLQLIREQEEADDAARTAKMQEVVDGKLRKKKKDGTDMDFDDSDEENEVNRSGNSLRAKEARRKRKLDRMDPMDALAEDPETQAFTKTYEETFAPDLDGYDVLLSDHEGDGGASEDEYLAKVGLRKQSSRSGSNGQSSKPRRRSRTTASPFPDSQSPSRSNSPEEAETQQSDVFVEEPEEAMDAFPTNEDDEEEEETESQLNIRRAGQRPLPRPVQKDEYELEPYPHHADPNSRRLSSTSSLSAKRARLAEYSKDESQNSIGSSKGGSGSSVNSMKPKRSTSNGSTVKLAPRRSGLPGLGGSKSGVVSSREGKWE